MQQESSAQLNHIELFLQTRRSYSQGQVEEFNRIQKAMDVGVDAFLKGMVFSSTPYSEEEIASILSELEKMLQEQFVAHTPYTNPTYTATAGAPGCGKSFYLEADQNIKAYKHPEAIYADPDRYALPNLAMYQRDKDLHETAFSSEKYQVAMSLPDTEQHGSAYAYDKWRDASNFITNIMLIMACVEGRNIVHGTTSTNPRVIKIYQTLRSLRYRIRIDALYAETEQRAASLAHRAKTMVQATDEDFRNKAKPSFFRVTDAYLPFANTVNFLIQRGAFWLGAGETKNFATFEDGAFKVHDEKGLHEFSKIMRTELIPPEAEQFEAELQKAGLELPAAAAQTDLSSGADPSFFKKPPSEAEQQEKPSTNSPEGAAAAEEEEQQVPNP